MSHTVVMDKEISPVEFLNIKRQTLENPDNSKKGQVDNEIKKVIDYINLYSDYSTTSSCSGRIVVLSQEGNEHHKKHCDWKFVSHNLIEDEDEFIRAINKGVNENLFLKFEPLILHVQCRTLPAAKILLTIGFETGFKNSGIVLGKHGKVMLALRNTMSLEIPLSYNSKILVTEEYIRYCVVILNEKMKKNFEQIKKFEKELLTLEKRKEKKTAV